MSSLSTPVAVVLPFLLPTIAPAGAPYSSPADSPYNVGSFNHPNCELFIQEDDYDATFGLGQMDQVGFSMVLRVKGYKKINFFRGTRIEDLSADRDFKAPVLTLDMESSVVPVEEADDELERQTGARPRVRWTLRILNHVRNAQGIEIRTESKSQFPLTIDPDQYASRVVYEKGINQEFYYQIPSCIKKP